MLRRCGFAALTALLALPLGITASAQVSLPPSARASLDSVIDWLVARELVPGVAIAIVSGDRVIYRRDAGWADREAGRRVDEGTAFYIASVTKSMTALATTLLDRERIVRLDATVADILPGVQFGAGVEPSRITVRQLLSHTSGINGSGPVGYRAAFSGEVERGAMLRALALHGPAQNGTAYAYTNFGYNLLSLALDSIARRPWQDLLAERVFRPLGMTSTSARVSAIPRTRLAMPYRVAPEGLERMPYAKTDANMQAAGGVVSTTADLARLVIAELNGGRVDGRQAIPADVIAETQRPVATYTQDAGPMRRFAYALGWQHVVADGDTLLQHGGGFPGFAANVSFLPRRQLGYVALWNGGFGPELDAPMMLYVYALLTGNGAAAAQYRALLDGAPERAAQQRRGIVADRARRAARPQTMALPLSAYAGRFEHAAWGSMEVSVQDGRLAVRNGVLETVAEVFDGAQHQIRVELEPTAGRVLNFVVEGDRVVAAEYQGVRFARVR